MTHTPINDRNTVSTTAGKCGNAMHTVPYGGVVHAPCKSASPNILFELAASTYKYQFLRDTKFNIQLPIVSLLTDAQLPTETPRVGSP